MAISKIKSKKHGYTYQVDVRYKDYLGVTQRYVKSGFKTKAEAKVHEAIVIEKANSKSVIVKSHSKTIYEVFKEYMKVEGLNKYAPATKFNYNRIFDMYMKDTVGKIPIEKADYSALQKFINDCFLKYNHSTLTHIKKNLSLTFKYAMRVGYITNNPVFDVVLPRKLSQEEVKNTISDEDIKSLIQRMQQPSPKRRRTERTKHSYRAFEVAIIIGRYTGLRLSEILGLKKEDFDLENHKLKVQRRLEYAGLKAEEMYLTDKLKTRGSKSVIEISKGLCEYLRKWFEENPYDFVICDIDGCLIPPSTITDKTRRVAKELGIKFHFHMLRHTYATELMMSDIKPVVVKDLLRHSKVNITWDVYTHPNEELYREAIDSVYKNKEQSIDIDLSGFQLK
ncbi:MAG: site-specific integrase [Erysipelotrichales bacterium]|nr:site-specific integrase [Erysipelotrichales bacterium]